MQNHVEHAVEATVGVERRAKAAAETKKEWVAPELRKVAIEEVTAANFTMNKSDGSFAS